MYDSGRILSQPGPFRHKVTQIVYLESFEIVDENIGEPELVDKLQVDRNHGSLAQAGARVEVIEEEARDLQPGLTPHHIEVRAELHAVLLSEGDH